MSVSITKIAIKNSFILNFILFMPEKIQTGVMNVVSNINKIEILPKYANSLEKEIHENPSDWLAIQVWYRGQNSTSVI